MTYDLTLAAARPLARLNPTMVFLYVSGVGTDSSERGRSMWARVKGATENALLALPFHAVMFRPGAIVPLHGIRSKVRTYDLIYRLFAAVARRIATVSRAGEQHRTNRAGDAGGGAPGNGLAHPGAAADQSTGDALKYRHQPRRRQYSATRRRRCSMPCGCSINCATGIIRQRWPSSPKRMAAICAGAISPAINQVGGEPGKMPA